LPKKNEKKGRKTTRRSQVKYPALDPAYNPKINREYFDVDYVDQLNDKEKEWLNAFEEEFSNAAVGKQSEAEKNRFHKTKEEVKECTDRKNARQRCLYGISKANGLVMDDLRVENDASPSNVGLVEDALIAEIDRKHTDDTSDD